MFTAGAAPTPTVNVTGVPAATAVVGPVMLTPVRALRLTVTVAVLPATFAVTIVVRVAVRRRSRHAARVGRRRPRSELPLVGGES